MEEELKDMKAHKDYYNMLYFVAYAQQGIPKICPCGSITKENDGLHFRQPWGMGMQQEVERLKIKVYEQEKLLRECQALKEQVRMLHMRLTELETGQRRLVSKLTH
ncbi:hypothetical protein F2Q69_00050660 [Brassica cretica]|uniref:Uncharacterized protein n=1 Tax=Brassica cretica TaxID=69181 RepID=A0A8S9PTE8_BRACR|nr:hypothetical protein F2Q69_00050660 [Brassica cretica]